MNYLIIIEKNDWGDTDQIAFLPVSVPEGLPQPDLLEILEARARRLIEDTIGIGGLPKFELQLATEPDGRTVIWCGDDGFMREPNVYLCPTFVVIPDVEALGMPDVGLINRSGDEKLVALHRYYRATLDKTRREITDHNKGTADNGAGWQLVGERLMGRMDILEPLARDLSKAVPQGRKVSVL